MAARINGFSLAYTAAGAVVLWSGIKGWSISATFQNLLKGTTPASSTETIDTTSVEESDTTGTDSGGGSAAYNSSSALEKLWTANGGDEDTAAIAAAIAMAESGGSATATSSNPGGPGCTNVGIWQLATPCGVGAGYSVAELENADTNARLTVMATGNGRDWSSWADPVANALPGHQYTPGDPVPGAVGAV